MRGLLARSRFLINCIILSSVAATLTDATVLKADEKNKDEPKGGSDKASLEKVQEFFAKFGKGDIPGVLNTMSEDVNWFIPGPSTIPYAGQRKGREEAGKFFGAFSDAVEVQKFEPREFITQKDKVVVLGHEVLKVKTTAKVVDNEWVMVFTVDKDKITRFRSYEDTAALVAAFGK